MLIGYNNSLMILQLPRRSQFIPILLGIVYPYFYIMSNSKKKNQLDFFKILEIDIKIVIIETKARKNKIIVIPSSNNLL